MSLNTGAMAIYVTLEGKIPRTPIWLTALSIGDHAGSHWHSYIAANYVRLAN
jgi:hypothetical protein